MIAAHRLAAELLGRDHLYRLRDLRPRVMEDGSIVWTVPAGAGPAPDAAELAAIEALKPEFLKELKDRGFRVPVPPSGTPLAREGNPTVAPKVPPGVRAEVRRLVGRLRVDGATNADVMVATKALVKALGPHADHDRTVASFHRWCGHVRKGTLPESVVQDAFEAACGRNVENRGAVFVALVKDHEAKK